MYSIKEMFFTLQGEGVNAGRPAVFCRFSGCNLWSGLDRDRSKAACRWCDTDFVGSDAGRFVDANELAERLSELWPGRARLNLDLKSGRRPLVVLTGGEPMLQVDAQLISAVKACDFEIAIETNGTIPVATGVDWITVSPKYGTEVVQRSGKELKLVFPQEMCDPCGYLDWKFDWFCLQPMAGPCLRQNVLACVDYVRRNPRWRLSLQAHKILGIE